MHLFFESLLCRVFNDYDFGADRVRDGYVSEDQNDRDADHEAKGFQIGVHGRLNRDSGKGGLRSLIS